jgi:hypothetical protein
VTVGHHHRTPSGAIGERGVVGGAEVLPFGFLVFVVGTLLLVNAWAVVDAKLTVESAAREAGRSYVEAGDARAATAAARRSAREVVAGAGRDPDRLVLSNDRPAYVRCAVVNHEATYRVPSLTLPFVGGFGRGITVHGRHRDVIDPFASGLGGTADCGG